MEINSKSVLIVEDEPDLAALMTYRLRRIGFEVFNAEDGSSATEILKGMSPDLVFLDLRLPDTHGMDLCAQIKSNPRLRRVPVVFSTADASIKLKDAAKTAQADGFLLKPFGAKDLLKMVKRFFELPALVRIS